MEPTEASGRVDTFELPELREGEWIGVDFDGVLTIEDFSTFPQINAPIPRMVELVRGWLARGMDIRIFTARVGLAPDQYNAKGQNASIEFCDAQRDAIQAWCIVTFGRALPVTATKDFKMRRLIDDRCIQMISNRGVSLQETIREGLQSILEPILP